MDNEIMKAYYMTAVVMGMARVAQDLGAIKRIVITPEAEALTAESSMELVEAIDSFLAVMLKVTTQEATYHRGLEDGNN